MDVDFGRGNALMAQHLLNGAQVGSPFKQVGGKTVAQGVRADDLAHACQFAQLLDDVENHLPREHGTTAVQEQDVLVALFRNLMRTRLLQIELNLLNSYGRDGYQTLFVALALDDDVTLLQIELRKTQTDQFAHAQAAAVECLNDGTVALPLGLGHIDAGIMASISATVSTSGR